MENKSTELAQNPPFCKTDVSGSFLLRVLLSPFIFLWGCFMLAAGTLFPLPLLVGISLYGLLLEPFIWLLRKSGYNINGIEPFIDDTGNNLCLGCICNSVCLFKRWNCLDW